MNAPHLTRRPIRARDTKWAARTARWLGRIGLRPNQISVLSVVVAGIGAACLVFTNRVTPAAAGWLFVAAAICIQLRLLCNLFDGMVAVEGGFKTKSGEIYNELPDRFADAFVLVGAGYSFASTPLLVTLGWGAALAAVVTAYVRTLGAASGSAQYFVGPMAKQQRMATLTLACLGTALGILLKQSFTLMVVALPLILAGCGVTIWRRCRLIVSELERK